MNYAAIRFYQWSKIPSLQGSVERLRIPRSVGPGSPRAPHARRETVPAQGGRREGSFTGDPWGPGVASIMIQTVDTFICLRRSQKR